VTATIQAGIPGKGGDIGYGSDSRLGDGVRYSADADRRQNEQSCAAMDRARAGIRYVWDMAAVWLTDYRRGLIFRIPNEQVLKHWVEWANEYFFNH